MTTGTAINPQNVRERHRLIPFRMNFRHQFSAQIDYLVGWINLHVARV